MYKTIVLMSIAVLVSVAGMAAFAETGGSVNSFNRLMTPKPPANLPPAEDGVHDPENAATYALQHPKEAFEALIKSGYGNHVDWVKSLGEGKFAPRTNMRDPDVNPIVMDLDIVREVRGSMADVVFPHDRHTAVLDCSNCHPAIFIPQKGANQMSMANIMLGQTCGVCHGTVAFPVTSSTCTLCHAKPKDESAQLKRSQFGAR